MCQFFIIVEKSQSVEVKWTGYAFSSRETCLQAKNALLRKFMTHGQRQIYVLQINKTQAVQHLDANNRHLANEL